MASTSTEPGKDGGNSTDGGCGASIGDLISEAMEEDGAAEIEKYGGELSHKEEEVREDEEQQQQQLHVGRQQAEPQELLVDSPPLKRPAHRYRNMASPEIEERPQPPPPKARGASFNIEEDYLGPHGQPVRTMVFVSDSDDEGTASASGELRRHLSSPEVLDMPLPTQPPQYDSQDSSEDFCILETPTSTRVVCTYVHVKLGRHTWSDLSHATLFVAWWQNPIPLMFRYDLSHKYM